MEIETALAKASLTRVERRDPYNLFHKMDLDAACKRSTPDFDWAIYLSDAGLAASQIRSTSPSPSFTRKSTPASRALSLDDMKTYLRWHIAHAGAPYLSYALRERELRFLQQHPARRSATAARAGSAASRWSTGTSAKPWARYS